MRGQPNTFTETWINPHRHHAGGELIFTVFPGDAVPFLGCTRLDGIPIAPADAHQLLEQIGGERGAMPYIGDGRFSVSPRRPM